jgi:hypothetical protein
MKKIKFDFLKLFLQKLKAAKVIHFIVHIFLQVISIKNHIPSIRLVLIMLYVFVIYKNQAGSLKSGSNNTKAEQIRIN